MSAELWSDLRAWPSLRETGEVTITMDAPRRAAIARRLDLESLDSLVATVSHEAWLDGVRLRGRVEAEAGRLCGVSLEPFVERVDVDLDVKIVPDGSPNAPVPEAELVIALDAEDPPDTAPGAGVDLGAYIVEALGLGLEPFPRAPGAVFEFVDPKPEASPFNVLSFLAAKPDNEG